MDKIKDSELLAKRAMQVQRGAARASVLGVNDGLVSTLCIVVGVAGAGAASGAVLLAGLAGLIAGAMSMAAGEWISVRAQVELFGGILQDIKKLVAEDRPLLEEQLAKSLSDTGHRDATAQQAAIEISESDDLLMAAYARQVMGFNPDELGSPWIAALSSGALFIAGSLAPLFPWFFGGGVAAIVWSVALTGVGSLAVGGYISASSGKPVMYGALRQLVIVIFASVITYGIGYIFGVSVH